MTPALDLSISKTPTDFSNPALKDFNISKTNKQTKKKQEKKRKSSQKFPMPKNYKPNEYPDRNLSPLQLTREMIEYYDFKKKPESYNKFIENTLNYKKKTNKTQKKPEGKRTLEKKKTPENANHNENDRSFESGNEKSFKTIEGSERKVYFEEVEQFHFALNNNVKTPRRNGNFLPYLAAEIGKSDDKIQVKMLKDCGASDSLLDINEYKRLKNHKNIHITIVNLKMVTPNATTENAIQGEVILEMTLCDISGRKISYNWPFLLADLGGRQKCILGYDFLSREDLIIGETPRHLFLKNGKEHQAIEIFKCGTHDEIARPTAVNKNDVTIKANSAQVIEFVCESNFTEISTYDKKECLFQPINLSNDHQNYGLILEPVLTKPNKKDSKSISFYAMITNTNNEPMTLEAGTTVGNLEDISDSNKMSVSNSDFKTLIYNMELLGDTETDKEVKYHKQENSELHTFTIHTKDIEVNSMFNRREGTEKDIYEPDGSIKTQMTANVEDILGNETYIDPSELLDKDEPLDVSMADFKSVPEEHMPELMEIVGNEMKDIWSKHKWDIGKTDRIEHDIETKEGVIVKDKKRPIPFQRLQYAKKAVNTLMKYNLVTPAYNSKWATNLVLVQKPAEGALRDSTKASQILNKHKNVKCTWRLTQDLRQVNQNTTNLYTANLPTIDEIVNKVRNKVVTQIDVNQAYFTIPLSKRSCEKTSFYLNTMLYMWERMTQGLAGAPHTWMTFMQLIFCDEVLKEYKETFPDRGKRIKEKHWSEFLSIYMDDLDIFSNTPKENLDHIHAVFWVLRKEGCLLNPKKASFMVTNFTTLGVNINTKENSVSIDKKRAQAILSWPKPSSLIEVMSRIQSLNYLSKNLPKLKEIAYPLMTLLRKKVFEWTEEHQTAWEHLKQLIRLDIKLTIPDENLEYVTSSDTSKIAVAGNLWNYDPKNGKLYLLGCMSKLLSVSDSLKPPFHKECLALCLNLKTWESYILGTMRRITALCDARGVMWLHRNKEFSNKLTTISLYISQFRNLVIWHIPGSQNQLADIFSRSYHGSAHKTKEDFRLSKTQAQKLPPLPDPCVLSPEDLFKIFTTLPQTEEDFDRGNRKRRPLPTPKPILNIMKQLGDATPEEKFVSARRILAGWNDQSLQNEETKGKITRLNHLEMNIEKAFIDNVQDKLEKNQITVDENLKERLDNISMETITPMEKVRTLQELNDVIPEKQKKEIKREIKEQWLSTDETKDLLEELIPSYTTIGDQRIKIPKTEEDKQILKDTIKLSNEEEEQKQEVILNILETIQEDIEREEEISQRTEERMIITMADIFENKGKISAETLRKLQDSDRFCGKTKRLIREGKSQPSFKIINDILTKLEFDTIRQKYVVKIVLPNDIMPMVTQNIHNSKTIHQPKTGCLIKFKKYFYNREAATYFQQAIDRCILCKYTHKPSGTAEPGPGKTRTLVLEDLKPREGIAVDLAVNLPITKDNYCHVLTVVCLKTNYGQIYPLKSKTASEVCENLEQGWIKHFLPPKYIYSDMGKEFTGQMTKLCLKYGITQFTTFPHSHQGNRAELLVKAFKNNTRKLVHDYSKETNPKEWNEILPILMTKMNQSTIYLTKTLTRELLMFGDEQEGSCINFENDSGNYYENRDIVQDKSLTEYDKLRKDQKKYYKPPKSMDIKENDLIFIKNRKEEYPKSLKVPYIGPIRVTKVYPLGITGYHVISGEEMSAHFNHIKKLTINQFEESMPKGWHKDIKEHILSIEKTKRTNKTDIIFEEEEEE